MKVGIYFKVFIVYLIFIIISCNYNNSNDMEDVNRCILLVGLKEYKKGDFNLWLNIYKDGILYIEPENEKYSYNSYDNFISKDFGDSWEGYSGDVPYSTYSDNSSANLSIGEELLDIKYNSNGLGWMVTEFEDDSNSVVFIKKTTDSGSTWTEQMKMNGTNRADIKIQSDNIVIIFLTPNIVLITHDGGSSWTQNNLTYGNDHSKMNLYDSGIGYITVNGKENSILYKTLDSGNNWTIYLNINGTGYDYYKNILVINESTIFNTQGSKIYRSKDGANSWEELDNSFAEYTYSTPMFPALPCQL